jgi:hypothetical protein
MEVLAIPEGLEDFLAMAELQLQQLADRTAESEEQPDAGDGRLGDLKAAEVVEEATASADGTYRYYHC